MPAVAPAHVAAPRPPGARAAARTAVGRFSRAVAAADRLPTGPAVTLLAALTVGTVALVLLSGGTGSGLALLLSVPVLVAALRFGTRGAVAVATAAALAGPAMPVSTAGDQPQTTSAWLTRAVVLLLVAVVAGAVVEARDRSADRRLALEVRDAIERPPPSRSPVDLDAFCAKIVEEFAEGVHDVHREGATA